MNKSEFNDELKNVLNDKRLIIDIISSIHDKKHKKEITIYEVNEIKASKQFTDKVKELVLEKISNKKLLG